MNRVPSRLHLALLVAVTLLLAGIALVLFTGGSASREALTTGSSGFAGALRPPIPPHDFRLTDQNGHAVRLSDYRGQVVIVTFLYTTCRDTCPVMAQQIRGALDDLGRPVPSLAVSVDPAGDTTARAKAFLLRQHLTGRMRFLLGTKAQLAPVWGDYGIRPQIGGGKDHSAYVVLVDRTGRQRIGFPANHLTPEGLAHDIRRLGGPAS
jgi:protein SCO1/2